MTESLESVEINVLGRAYRVSCQPDQYQLLRQAAQKLDDALGDLRIRARGSSNEQLAIMVALNLSHELLLEKIAFNNILKAWNNASDSLTMLFRKH